MIPLSNYLRNYQGKKRPYKGQVVIARLNSELEEQQLNKAISFGIGPVNPAL